MDRRATLSALLGRKRQPNTIAALQVHTTVSSGLEPYSGAWEYLQAGHLLRRCTFGPTYAQIKTAVSDGLEATVNQLLSDQPQPNPPTNYYFQDDPNVPIGETWIDAPYSPTVNYQVYRNRSLAAWTMELMYEEGISIREKMTLFWHNHFVIENINDPKYVYQYIALLRQYALGNFRELTKAVTIDPAMLRYLNGNQNTRTAPNENYARELLELFTVGKGELAGSGDYTTFTEDDVVAMARVLTGWVDRGYLNPTGIPVESQFFNARHDTDSKQLSHRFNNTVINNNGDQEYADLIDIIFQQEEVARFISRKLYRWFVYYTIDETVEQNVIEPMAQLLISEDFNVQPVLEVLLKSAHFYDMISSGCIIKNPIDFVYSVLSTMEVEIPANLGPRYNALFIIYGFSEQLQMQYFQAPNVAGWKAYYQEPQYYRTWINASTLNARTTFTNAFTFSGVAVGGTRIAVDPLKLIATIDDPFDVNSVIDEFVQILFPEDITQEQKDYLKEVLIPGLPDFEWNVEYSEYASDPGNEEVAMSIENKLRNLLRAMTSMAEFHLS
ncbi:MAG: DUF1800 domain-containing protein [Bacteroidota bacterium]